MKKFVAIMLAAFFTLTVMSFVVADTRPIDEVKEVINKIAPEGKLIPNTELETVNDLGENLIVPSDYDMLEFYEIMKRVYCNLLTRELTFDLEANDEDPVDRLESFVIPSVCFDCFRLKLVDNDVETLQKNMDVAIAAFNEIEAQGRQSEGASMVFMVLNLFSVVNPDNDAEIFTVVCNCAN